MSDGSVTIDTNLTTKNFEIGIKKLEGIGKKGLGVVTAASGAAIAGLTALGGYAIKVGSSFEAGMSKVQAISGATNEELTALTDKAKEMGAKTKFSATESAEAFQYMAMAGWKTGDMLNGIEGVMNLAAASGEDLASVSDIVTDALTAFGLQASDSAHFADVLAKASSNSNTNVGLMGETFKYVAPLAGSMGYSVEDTAVAIGLMANAGIKGSQAGTALRSTLTRLVKPPKEAAEALKNLGISATNSDGTMKPLSQTLGELRAKFSKLDESQKASYAASIAGQEAMSGLLAIVNASQSDYDKLVASINNADGAAKDMADTMNDNLAGATTIMQSTIESFGIAIYDKFCEPAKKGVKDVTKVFESLKKQIENGKLSKSIDKIADGFGKLITKAGDLTAKALPKAIDLLSWIVDHGGSIAKVIGTIAGSMAFLKTTALLSGPILSWQNAVKVLKTLESGSKNVTVAQAAMNGTLSLGQIAVGVLTGKISLATVAQKLWNTAISANPVGVFVGALVGLVAIIKVVHDKLGENQKQAEEFTKTMSDSKQALDDYNKSIDDNANKQLNQIEYVSRLKEELKKLVDENGRVTEGNQGRVAYILNELNSALGTEYSLNEGIVQSYQDIQKSIDDTIAKKKAEVLLNAEYEKYQNAVENQGNAVDDLKQAYDNLGMSLKEAKEKYQQMEDGTIKASKSEKDLLKEKIDAYETAESTVKQYTENVKQYETDYANFAEGKYDEIGKTIKNTTKDWTDSTLDELSNSITAQETELEKYKNIYKETGNEIARQQMEQAQTNLQTLQDEFSVRGQIVAEKGLEENEKWKTLSENNALAYTTGMSQLQIITGQSLSDTTSVIETNTSVENGMANLGDRGKGMYQRGIDPMSQDTKNKLAEIAGVVNQDTSVESASDSLGKDTANIFGVDVANMPVSMRNETTNIANVLNSDSSVGAGAVRLAGEANSNFNNNIHGHKWGADLTDNLSSGMMSRRAAVSNAASTIASIIHSFLGHSVPEKGPLADEMSYMPDMVDNLVKTLIKSSPKLEKATSNLAEKMVDRMKDTLGIHSPSQVFRDEVGKNIVKGLVEGIEDGLPGAIRCVTALSNAVLSTAKKQVKNGNYKEVGKTMNDQISDSIEKYSKNTIQAINNLVNTSVDNYSNQMDAEIKKLKEQTKSQVDDEVKILEQAKKDFKEAGTNSIKAYTQAISDYSSKAKETVSSVLNEIGDEFQTKFDELERSRKSLQDKLSDFGDLYKTKGNKVVLNDLQKQIDSIKIYTDNLHNIKGKVSTDLFKKISEMDIKNGNAYIKKLLEMTDEELTEYNNLYTEKLNLAKNLSDNIYDKDFEELNHQYGKAIETTVQYLNGQFSEMGQQAMSGLISGMSSQVTNMSSEVQRIAQTIVDEFKNRLQIHSPSRVLRDKIGKNIALGIGVGFTENMKEVYKKMRDSVNFETQKMSASISATANLKASKDRVRTVYNDKGNTFHTTQNFYDKQASPYEQQKQSKQQLRRLAYEL